ncbi:MAG: SDR family oxidoreductase [Lachnospiraceae bacterium]|nr:SDR family oxidoreductase [Lachnospiraceae bacterium]
MTEVRGKWAFVTGASRGIGYLVAELLAKQGCNLVLQSRSIEHLDGIMKVAKENNVEAYGVAAELSDLDSVKAMLDEIEAIGTQIDFVLNNAGMQIAYRTEYFDTPVSDYTESFKINTIAPAMICYHFMPQMIKRGFGRIVNTTSGIRLEPQQAGYSASKAALDKITIDLGSTVEGTDVMINLADPGWCRTDLGGDKAPNAPESALPGVVLGVFADDKRSGRLFSAGDYHGMTLEQAVDMVESKKGSIYN